MHSTDWRHSIRFAKAKPSSEKSKHRPISHQDTNSKRIPNSIPLKDESNSVKTID